MAVKIPKYERSVNLNAAADTVPRIPVADGFGRGLKEMGTAISAVAARLQAREEQHETFKATQEWQRLQDEAAVITMEERDNYDPARDPPGTLRNRVMQRLQPLIDKAVGNIPDRLRPQYVERAKTFTADYDRRIAVAENQTSDNYAVKFLTDNAAAFAKAVRKNPDSFEGAEKSMIEAIDGSALPAARKRVLKDSFIRNMTLEAAQGYAEQGRPQEGVELGRRMKEKYDTRPEAAPGPQSGGGRVIQEQGAVAAKRKDPLDPKLEGVLSKAAATAGVDVKVFSGGQKSQAEGTGSTRHNHGLAGDVRLHDPATGRVLSPENPQDLPRIQAFVASAKENGATGIGAGPGYMGGTGIHVGFGTPGIWGRTRSKDSAPTWLQQAYSAPQKILSAFTGPAANAPAGAPAATAAAAAGPKDGGRSERAMQFFVEKGLTPAQAAGLVGNLIQEGHDLNPARVHDGGKGIGIAGWNGTRREALRQFTGGDETNFDKQLAFLWQELNSTEKAALDRIKAAEDPRSAAAAAQTYFRPGIPNAPRRAALAEQMFTSAQSAGQPREEAPVRVDARGRVVGGVQVASANPGFVPEGNAEKPILKNKDGSFSTEKTITIEADGKHHVIPTIVDGKELSEDDAVKAWREGKNRQVGEFDSAEEADTFARGRSEQIGAARGAEAGIQVAQAPRVGYSAWDALQDRIDGEVKAIVDKGNKTRSAIKREVSRLITDDITSMTSTGQGVKLPPQIQKMLGVPELNYSLIEQATGDEGLAARWEAERETARSVYHALNGMDEMPFDELRSHVLSLAPEPGAYGYAKQKKIADAAAVKAQAIGKARLEDPAEAVNLTARVRGAMERVRANPQDAEAAEALARARMDEQARLGIPSHMRSPISKLEAQQLIGPLMDDALPESIKNQHLTRLNKQIRLMMGGDEDMAARALETILKEKGFIAEQRDEITQSFMRAGRPFRDAQDVDKKSFPERQRAAATAAAYLWPGMEPAEQKTAPRSPANPVTTTFPGANDDGAFVPGSANNGVMSAEHVLKLRRGEMNPEAFDQLYGVGAADWTTSQPSINKGVWQGPTLPQQVAPIAGPPPEEEKTKFISPDPIDWSTQFNAMTFPTGDE